jgi:hypothetical protein
MPARQTPHRTVLGRPVTDRFDQRISRLDRVIGE